MQGHVLEFVAAGNDVLNVRIVLLAEICSKLISYDVSR